MSQKIFVVEDDAITAEQLKQYIEEMGYQFAGKADNAEDALDRIAQTQPDLVLMDIHLKGEMDGIDAAAQLHADNLAPVIYLTAYTEDDTLARAKLTEPLGYMVKPFIRQELKASVEMGLYKHEAERKQQRLFDAVVRTITEMTKLHDPMLAELQPRAAAVAEAMATELGLPGQEVRGIRLAALLHNIGQVAIPTALLYIRDALQGAEKAYFQSHPEVAWEVLKEIEFPYPVAETVYQHMERLDGSGFPRGLSGDAILPGARILAVACRVAKRLTPYGIKPPASVDEVIKELEDGRGRLFDAGVVDACIRLFREKGYRLTGA
ncbi:MAG: HD domain-containing phosphohydrolase [Chromatiaceae bacterium]